MQVNKISDLSKYASGFFNFADSIGSIANAISSKELEELKSRLEKLIEELGLRLVIVIDDIDRLDKDEVQAIFKIVKLNADFKNTVYVLSFDDKMVSQMMSDKYGGDSTPAKIFLKK
jgi:predicted KAP-like P-loop ATPase